MGMIVQTNTRQIGDGVNVQIPRTLDDSGGVQISTRLRQGATNDCTTDYHIRTYDGGECQREYDTHPVDVEFRHKGYTGNLEIADSQFPESEGFFFPLRPDDSEGVVVFDTTTHTIYVDGQQYPTVGSQENVRDVDTADELTTASESGILSTAEQSMLEQAQSQPINPLDLLGNGNDSTNANVITGTTTIQTSRTSESANTNMTVTRRIGGSSLTGSTIANALGRQNNRFATITNRTDTSINRTSSGYRIRDDYQPNISLTCQDENGSTLSDLELASINQAALELLG